MHIGHIRVSNIRSLKAIHWKPARQESLAGWHVVIGDNGSGKSTFMKAVALALVGRKNGEALRQDWATWLAHKEPIGSISLSLVYDSDDKWKGRGARVRRYYLGARLFLSRETERVQLLAPSRISERHVWSDKSGWFSASFGPFRRFTGGDRDYEKLYYSHPKLARHLSVFGENIALSECLSWLQELRFKQLESGDEHGFLNEIVDFINQPGFLPHGVRFESVSSAAVTFIDGNSTHVDVNALGDGFRSVLSFSFELIRQLESTYGASSLFVKDGDRVYVARSGVVLIDEIDAHLHPTWQRRIGHWLTRHFPKLQFIVTTHSPLVCQAAENGSIFKLATPGSDQESKMLDGLERERLLFGSVLDAYGTELFGSDVSRSDSAKAKQARLAELNQRFLSGSLSKEESVERDSLLRLFPSLF